MKYFIWGLLIFLLAACGSGENPVSPSEGILPSREKGLQRLQQIEIAGVDRKYHLYVPDQAENAPIVMLFHSREEDFNSLMGFNGEIAPFKLWLDKAEEENILLAIPNGLPTFATETGWNDCRTDASGISTSDDVAFISILLDTLVERYNADESRVYLSGLENGGQFCMRLAQEMPERIAAFASLFAAKPVNSLCDDSDIAVSAMIWSALLDPIVPYDGGEMTENGGAVFSGDSTARYWARRNNTFPNPALTFMPNIVQGDDCRIIRCRYANGTNFSEVTHFKIVNGGHLAASKVERYSAEERAVLGRQNADVEMVEEVWNFFREKTR